MKIVDHFDEVAKEMRSALKKSRNAFSHPGARGASAEEAFRDFLRKYLPASLNISTGFLIDTQGQISRQLDVIISDAAKTPILYQSGEIRVIPVECAYAVIEIKTRLESGKIKSIFENMLSVRRLRKSSYQQAGMIGIDDTLYGRKYDIWPVMYFVFAFEADSLVSVTRSIIQRHEDDQLPEHSRIDTVCVLDAGVILNRNVNKMWDALPSPGSQMMCRETPKALLLFYALLSHYLNQARMPNFRFLDYLGEMEF